VIIAPRLDGLNVLQAPGTGISTRQASGLIELKSTFSLSFGSLLPLDCPPRFSHFGRPATYL
jgi:hypothetical protein